MFDSITERVSRHKRSSYAVQLTGGTRTEYDEIIANAYDSPLIEVDCANLDGYDDFFATIGDDLTTDITDGYNQTWAVKEHFETVGGSLVLHNFHALDKETTSKIAMYIKGLWEDVSYNGDSEFAIAITTDDTDALFIGNGDLSGRVLTLSVAEEVN